MKYESIIPAGENLQWAFFQWIQDASINAAANAWRTIVINVDSHNGIDGCVRNGSQITLPKGVYVVSAMKSFQRTHHSRIGFYSVTRANVDFQGVNTYHYTDASTGYGVCGCQGIVNIDQEEVFELRYYTRTAGYNGLGSNTSYAKDCKASLTITKLIT